MAILNEKTASALEGQSGRFLCDICEIRQSNCCVSDFFYKYAKYISILSKYAYFWIIYELNSSNLYIF